MFHTDKNNTGLLWSRLAKLVVSIRMPKTNIDLNPVGHLGHLPYLIQYSIEISHFQAQYGPAIKSQLASINM